MKYLIIVFTLFLLNSCASKNRKACESRCHGVTKKKTIIKRSLASQAETTHTTTPSPEIETTRPRGESYFVKGESYITKAGEKVFPHLPGNSGSLTKEGCDFQTVSYDNEVPEHSVRFYSKVDGNHVNGEDASLFTPNSWTGIIDYSSCREGTVKGQPVSKTLGCVREVQANGHVRYYQTRRHYSGEERYRRSIYEFDQQGDIVAYSLFHHAGPPNKDFELMALLKYFTCKPVHLAV